MIHLARLNEQQFCAGLIGASQCNSYGSLMTCRVIHAFGSGVCEALPIQLVNDIFFLHERGKRLGCYVICVVLGSTGPLHAGYMLRSGYSWRLFFYVTFAFAIGLLLVTFLFVEETQYKRCKPAHLVSQGTSIEGSGKTASTDYRENELTQHEERRTFAATLNIFTGINREVQFFLTIARSFTYFLQPFTFWVITTCGSICISGY